MTRTTGAGRTAAGVWLWCARIVGALVLVTGTLAALVLWTQPGTSWALALAKRWLPEGIGWQAQSGRLAGRMEFRDVDFRFADNSGHCDCIVLDGRLLPLLRGAIRIDSLRLSGLRVEMEDRKTMPPGVDTAHASQAESGPPFSVDLVIGALAIDGGSAQVPGVGPISQVSLSASGSPQGYRVAAEARLDMWRFGETPIGIYGAGDHEHFVIDSLWSAPAGARATAAGRVDWSEQFRFDLAVKVDSLAPAEFLPKPELWPGWVDLFGWCRGALDSTGLSLSAGLDSLRGTLRDQQLHGKADLSWTGGRVEASNLWLQWGPLAAEAHGAYADSLDVSFELGCTDIGLLLSDAQGEFTARGNLKGDFWSPGLESRLAVLGMRWGRYGAQKVEGSFRIEPGSLGQVALDLDVQTVLGLPRALDSVTVLARGTKQDHRIEMSVFGISTSIDLAAHGSWSEQIWQGSLADLVVSTHKLGNWRLQDPVSLVLSGRECRLEELCLESDQGEICLAGSWQRADDWKVESHARQLPLSWIPPLHASVRALSGPLDWRVRIGRKPGEAVRAEIELAPGPGFLVVARDSSLDTLGFERGTARATADSDSTHASCTLVFHPGRTGPACTLAVLARLPDWRVIESLPERTPLAIVRALPWRGSVTMRDWPLALTRRFAPSGVEVEGRLDVLAWMEASPQGDLSGQVDLGLEPGTAYFRSQSDTMVVRWRDASLTARVDDLGARFEVNAAFAYEEGADLGFLRGQVRLPQAVRSTDLGRELPLEGELNAELELALLDGLAPQLRNTAGKCALNTRIGGTTHQPELQGTFDIAGRTDVRPLGISLEDVHIKADAQPSGITLQGEARSGRGRLKIRGNSHRLPTEESPSQFEIEGSDFLIWSDRTAQIEISPDLQLSFTGQGLSIQGDVGVPRAHIVVDELPPTAVVTSKDAVVVGGDASGRARKRPVQADLKVTLGEEVFFKGFGCTTHLEGELSLRERPDAITRGQGELRFREGRYRGFGTDLKIDPGRIVFDGPVDNPSLDGLAYRTASDGTKAGFKISGRLVEPVIEPYSDPDKSQEEIMSYILFGRSLSDGSEAEQSKASGAAAMVGGNMLAMRAATQVGLDDATIETGSTKSDAAFFAGKYLSPKLYVAYGTGIYESINTLRVRYILSHHFTLQAETGTYHTADIVYQVER